MLCPTCDVPMSPRRLVAPAPPRLPRDAGAVAAAPTVASWQCWGCGKVRYAPRPAGGVAA